MPIILTWSGTVATASGPVWMGTGGGGSLPLVVITPVGAAWLATALPGDLGDLFTVHIVELPGTGRSYPADGSVELAVQATREIIAATTGDESLLFGHSMNGTLALAAASGKNYGGVIAVAPAPAFPHPAERLAAYWEAHAEPDRKQRADAIRQAYEASDDDAEKAGLYAQYNALRQWFDLEFDPTELDELAIIDGEWVQGVLGSAAVVDWPATLEAVASPVLLAFGGSDFMVPVELWDDAVRPPRTTIEIFERSAHNPFVEQPDEFVAAVDRWLHTTRSSTAQ